MPTAREFRTEQLRNVVVLGHGGAGKTALVDALAWVSGVTPRHTDLKDGQALTMHTPEEAAHGISVQLSPAWAEWEGTRVNLIDTPGYLDFTGETKAAVRVADAAVIVVGATSGVEVGTEKVWEYCEERGIPRMFFVSMIDKEHADFTGVYRQIRALLTPAVVPVEIPIGEGPDFRGIINLFSRRAHFYTPDGQKGEYTHGEIPDESRERFELWETELQERLATIDERFLEHYLEGGRLSREEALEAMARGMARGELVPLFCGSGRSCHGTRALLRKMVELFPHPGETAGEIARSEDGEEVELACSDDGPLAALVFKTVTEPHVGELSYFRLVSGSVANGDEVVHAASGATEKLGHLALALGRDRVEVARLHAGDIGVVTRLRHTRTNDTLCSNGHRLSLAPIRFPRPDIAVAVVGSTRSDDDKLGEVLPRLHDEDPTFQAEFDPELHQTIARGLGELHLEVQFERLKRKYHVSIETAEPRIAYRETVTATAEAQGRYKKQTGGRGQFGDCRIRISPRARGEGYTFIDSIKGGVIPGKFIPSVDRGIREAAARGVVAGYPMVDFSAEVIDGSFHSVDSSDVAFKVAGSMAFQAAAAEARPRLLEPIMEVTVTTPEEFMGEIMGDLSMRRGRVLGMETLEQRATIRARVPQAELYKYANALRSMTRGRAHHVRVFAGYEFAPEDEVRRVADAARA